MISLIKTMSRLKNVGFWQAVVKCRIVQCSYKMQDSGTKTIYDS